MDRINELGLPILYIIFRNGLDVYNVLLKKKVHRHIKINIQDPYFYTTLIFYIILINILFCYTTLKIEFLLELYKNYLSF